MRRWMAVLLILAGIAFALGTGMGSDALQLAQVHRTTTGSVLADAKGLLKLVGFTGALNQIGSDVNVSRNYVSVGSITNNTTLPLTIRITVTPDFSLIPSGDRVCELAVQIDTASALVFTKSSSGAKSVTLQVASGKVLDVKVSLMKNKRVLIPTTFGLTANDGNGKLVLSLSNTTATPRQMKFK